MKTKTNLLVAIKNIINNPVTNLASFYNSSNKINSVGDSLELYIKDAFCNSLNVNNFNEKLEIFGKNFSFTGNKNNPPDIMILEGDAIEVKKIEGSNSEIALNSSYPKDKLYSDSPMITKDCRECENWKEKDMLYIVGVVSKSNILKSLWFVYGDCYAANKNIYERIINKMSSGLDELSDVEFAETKELGRVNKVDPLGITNLRIRGMWHIKNPNKVFNYIDLPIQALFNINVLILKDKYESFPMQDRKNIESLKTNGFFIKDVRIKSPNNPVKMIDAKLILFRK